MSRPLLAWAAAASLLLAACSSTPIGPDYQRPASAVVVQPGAAAPFAEQRAAEAPYSPAELPDHWWQLYRDTRLDGLVQQALVHNHELRQAMANLERVQALEAEVRGAQDPSVTLNGGPSYGHASGLQQLRPHTSPPSQLHYSAGAALSYSWDWLGQLHRQLEAAQAGSAAAAAALDQLRVQVAANTARAYAQACSTGAQLDAAKQSLALQGQALALTERLQQAGRVGQIDAARARAQLAQLQAALAPLQAQRQGALYRLATLTGELPQNFPAELAQCHVAPQLAGLIPVGDGAALLRRRPDLRQAEQELAATSARIGVAMADRYPRISLGLSAQSAGLASGLGRGDTWSWSLGPLISWTLPNTGIADARVAQAEAANRAAQAHFDSVVLNALRETETALNLYARELDRRAALQAARDQSAEVAHQARQLYQGGKTGYLEALDAERNLAASEAALAASQALLVDEQVQLFLALGGGWQP